MAQYVAIVVPLSIFISVVNASFCDNIKQKYAPSERYVSQHGEPRNITVYWNNDITRAAAAQLTVILRHALGYQYVHLQDSTFATGVLCYRKPLFEEIKLMVSMTLRPEYGDYFGSDKEMNPIIQENLFVHIPKSWRVQKQCTGAVINPVQFYKDISRLKDCGFEISSTGDGHFIQIYHLKANYSTVYKEIPLKESLIELKLINRTNLFRMLRWGNQSFLFLDYNIWDGDNDASIVEQKLCLHSNYIRKQKENNIIITTSMDVKCNEDEYASQLFQISKKFSPSLQSVRSILEIESSGQSIEEASCLWISKHIIEIDELLKIHKPDEKHYKIITFSCEGNNYSWDFITTLGNFILNHYYLELTIINYSVDCTNPNYLKEILNLTTMEITPSQIGVLIGGVKNVMEYEDTKILDSSPLPVFLFDTIDINVDLTKSVWLTNGRMIHIVLAIQHFIDDNDINQVIVLSDGTPTAEYFNDNLRGVYGSFLGYNVSNNLTLRRVKNILQKIIHANTNIIILNMNYDNAVDLLAAAVKLDINVDKKITWILREWKQTNITLNITYITFSFWSRNANDMSITNNSLDIKQVIKTLVPDHIWTPHTMAYTDAVLTLVKGFKDVTLKYPQARDDPQSKYVTQQFERSLAEISPVQVAFQNLTYKEHSPEDAIVYVEKWEGSQQKLLVLYRVNATSRSVQERQFERSLAEISPVQVAFQNLTYKEHSPEDAVVYVEKWEGSQQKLLVLYRVNATSRSVQERKIEFPVKMKRSGSNASLHSSSILLKVALIFLLRLVLADMV